MNKHRVVNKMKTQGAPNTANLTKKAAGNFKLDYKSGGV